MQSIDHAQVVVSEPVDNVGKAEVVAVAKPCAGKGEKVRAMLRARLGEDIYTSWFAAMEFDNFDGRVIDTEADCLLRNARLNRTAIKS